MIVGGRVKKMDEWMEPPNNIMEVVDGSDDFPFQKKAWTF